MVSHGYGKKDQMVLVMEDEEKLGLCYLVLVEEEGHDESLTKLCKSKEQKLQRDKKPLQHDCACSFHTSSCKLH